MPLRGYKQTDEHIQKLVIARSGHKYNLGKNHTEETKEKISKSLTGIKRSEETKLKMGKAKSGKNNYFYNRNDIAKRGNYKHWRINRAIGIKKKYYQIVYFIKSKLNLW